MEADTSALKLREKWHSDTTTLTKYLKKLIASTEKFVPPKMRSKTTISLYATEGMRTFRDNDEDAADLIIARCKKILNSRKTPYKLNECRIISGGLEATGAWIDANIQCEDAEKIGDYGVIEIGGASIQIVGDVDHKVSLKGWGKDETAKKLWLDDADLTLDMYNNDKKDKSLAEFYESNPLWNGGEVGKCTECKVEGKMNEDGKFKDGKSAHNYRRGRKNRRCKGKWTGNWDALIERLKRITRYGLNSAIVQVSWPKEKRPYKLAGIFKILEKRYFDAANKDESYFEQVTKKGKTEFETAVPGRESDDYGNQKHMPFSAALVTYLREALKFDDHVEDKGTDAQCDVEWCRGLATMLEFDSNGDKELDATEVKKIFECAKMQRKMAAGSDADA